MDDPIFLVNCWLQGDGDIQMGAAEILRADFKKNLVEMLTEMEGAQEVFAAAPERLRLWRQTQHIEDIIAIMRELLGELEETT